MAESLVGGLPITVAVVTAIIGDRSLPFPQITIASQAVRRSWLRVHIKGHGLNIKNRDERVP